MREVYIYLSNAAEQEVESAGIGLLDWKRAAIVAYAAKYKKYLNWYMNDDLKSRMNTRNNTENEKLISRRHSLDQIEKIILR